MIIMTAVIDNRLYQWEQTAEGDYHLMIWEDGVLIQDELFDPKDFQ